MADSEQRVGGELRYLFPLSTSSSPCGASVVSVDAGTAKLQWNLTPGADRDPRVLQWLVDITDDVFTDTAVTRIVTTVPAGDYAGLNMARRAGFTAEGIERKLAEDGRVELFWRSSLLRGEGGTRPELSPLLDPRTIDGGRPSHLVSEFHHVYSMPNHVQAGHTPTVDFERVHMRMALVKEEFAELCGAVYGPEAERTLLDVYHALPDQGERDVVESADALADLVYVIYGMALESGIDLDKVLAEVHRSNLSKLMPDGTVRRREDGKILKGPDFAEPRIETAMGPGETRVRPRPQ